MRTDPFTDTWMFLVGRQPDQLALGPWRWLLVALFLGALAASAWIAWVNWRTDPAQRRPEHLWMWLFRVLFGAMWFQGSLWKLPFPVSGGFQSWTEQIVENAAFDAHREFVRDVLLPNIALLQPVVFLTEISLGLSMILGFAVRGSSAIGILFVVQLWLGLYRLPPEWPWLFGFMAIAMGQFIVHGAGRSLGLDAMLRPHVSTSSRSGRLYALAS